MSESRKHNYRLIAIFISTMAAGIPLWTSARRQLDLLELDFLLIWIGLGFLASIITRLIAGLKARDLIGCFAIGYVLSVVIHFVSSILTSGYVQARFEISLLVAILAGVLSGALGTLLWSGFGKRPKKG